MTEREIARETMDVAVTPKYGGGTVPETVIITDFADAKVVAVEVEHYDGSRIVEFDYPTWRALRAAIIANGRVAE